METTTTGRRSPGGAAQYVHGYTDREARRLGEQADALAELLHGGTRYPAGSRVLEVGCGVAPRPST
ncbi:hypothetical protein [Actinomadura sp. CNU-125]|uniref:hypothetical protein n=1 Tax=Actinomadura sp. CNU-125 TaxID=1904961 RepID=UPI0021CCC0A0|nr:hypothetical protein [Actinomadura sp. CNU-125]